VSDQPRPTGIDLGTTNSAVAQLEGVDTIVLKNNEGDETTPSAVYVDRRGRLLVGRAARERQDIDPDNARAEFKAHLGVDRPLDLFPASGRQMSAEDLSAEVLKSLLHDVEQRTGNRPATAVVTVPAAFDLSASEATRRAATLAGLDGATLLPEPAAAAMAYGFQLTDADARWLIYDLGGGTFDAAVIEVREGEFRIARHCGDNVLGGKLVDWRIVEDLLLPALAREIGPGRAAPRRGDPAWRTAVAKLKRAAEIAKIQLSRSEVADVFVEVSTPSGDRVDLDIELTRRQVEEFTRPIAVRSVNLCRQALREAGLSQDAVDRVVLVGGPTQAPILRELLADPSAGLGIPLDHSQDPLTVVARGAAIFAGSRRASARVAAPATPGRWAVHLEYQPMGPDIEPLVVGRVIGAAGATTDGLRIEVHEPTAMPPWRSGAVPVAPDGIFQVTLRADRGRRNSYRIVLTDATGRTLPIEPATLTYTVGAVETDPPLAHSVGVGLEDNRVEWLLHKGRPLPARQHVTLRTTVAVRRGRTAGLIRVPVIEGEHPKADRNRRIGSLEVSPGDVSRDIPIGSEIDVTIEIDASRVVTTRAYLPVLDAEFEQVMSLRTEAVPDRATLERQALAELDRLADAQDRQLQNPSAAAAVVLDRIEQEESAREIRTLLAAADDPDAAATARQRILDLRGAVDDIEDSLQWPTTVREAHEFQHYLHDLVGEHGTEEDRRSCALVEARLAQAEEHHDLAALRHAIDQAQGLGARVLDRIGHLQFMVFERHTERLHEATDPALARVLHERGRQAAANGDVEQLRIINHQLWDLFDDGDGPTDAFSTVRRG
jgi:molecular chaperone DnaK